jgi:hypothetical protein
MYEIMTIITFNVSLAGFLGGTGGFFFSLMDSGGVTSPALRDGASLF